MARVHVSTVCCLLLFAASPWSSRAMSQAAADTCAADDPSCITEAAGRVAEEEFADEVIKSVDVQLLQQSMEHRRDVDSNHTELHKATASRSDSGSNDTKVTAFESSLKRKNPPPPQHSPPPALHFKPGCERASAPMHFDRSLTCGRRMAWLVANKAMDQSEAEVEICEEEPSKCKACCPTAAPASLPGYQVNGYTNRGPVTVMKGYHQTSPEVCALIIDSAFRAGRGGLCGGAIYFAMTPEATSTKAITAGSKGGCMIEAEVDVGHYGRYYAEDDGPARTTDGQKEKSCGPYSSMNAATLEANGDDTIIMRRGDGDELIIFEPKRVLSMKIIHFDCKWMCRGNCHKNWPSHCHK